MSSARRGRIVVLISGAGSLMQALLAASQNPDCVYEVVAVGADRADAAGLAWAAERDVPTFVCRLGECDSRADWDRQLAVQVASYRPELVVTAGFMKLLGPAMLAGAPIINSHPALLPSFPGTRAVRDALAHGVMITGTTVHLVDEGMDTGRILAQRAVEVRSGDTEATLHERIKVVERPLLAQTVAQFLNNQASRSR